MHQSDQIMSNSIPMSQFQRTINDVCNPTVSYSKMEDPVAQIVAPYIE